MPTSLYSENTEVIKEKKNEKHQLEHQGIRGLQRALPFTINRKCFWRITKRMFQQLLISSTCPFPLQYQLIL